MIEKRTTLAGSVVLDRAIEFFGERVPNQAAFPEHRDDLHLVLRGQGGEEIAIAVRADGEETRVRGSTLLFDHALSRFLASLPVTGQLT